MLAETCHTLHCSGKPQTKLPASCTVFPPSESILVRKFLLLYFDQWAEACPGAVQLYPHLHTQ